MKYAPLLFLLLIIACSPKSGEESGGSSSVFTGRFQESEEHRIAYEGSIADQSMTVYARTIYCSDVVCSQEATAFLYDDSQMLDSMVVEFGTIEIWSKVAKKHDTFIYYVEKIQEFEENENGIMEDIPGKFYYDGVVLVVENEKLVNLANQSPDKIRLYRNLIFAKYGYKFKSVDLINHFSKMEWYNPAYDNVDEYLDDQDRLLIEYFQSMEGITEPSSEVQTQTFKVGDVVATINGFDLVIMREEDVDGMMNVQFIGSRNTDGVFVDSLEVNSGNWGSAADCYAEGSDFEWNIENGSIIQIQDGMVDDCGWYTAVGEDEDQSYAVKMEIDNPKRIAGEYRKYLSKTVYSITDSGEFNEDESKSSYVSESSFSGFSKFDDLPKERLRILRNYIFARHGYKFKAQDLSDYFSEEDWYKPEFDNVDDKLTEGEKEIIEYLVELEGKK